MAGSPSKNTLLSHTLYFLIYPSHHPLNVGITLPILQMGKLPQRGQETCKSKSPKLESSRAICTHVARGHAVEGKLAQHLYEV